MLTWMHDHRVLLAWLTGAGVVLFVASIIVVPILILRIPHDYFAHEKRPASPWSHCNRALRLTLVVVKNVAGYLFFVAGLAMLVLPGQGLLTLLIGFLMVDFPGKYGLEKWVLRRPRILNTINWFRTRRARPPLTVASPKRKRRRNPPLASRVDPKEPIVRDQAPSSAR